MTDAIIETMARAYFLTSLHPDDHHKFEELKDMWPEDWDEALKAGKDAHAALIEGGYAVLPQVATPEMIRAARHAELYVCPASGKPVPICDEWDSPRNSPEDKAIWKAVLGYEISHASYEWPEWQATIFSKGYTAMVSTFLQGQESQEDSSSREPSPSTTVATVASDHAGPLLAALVFESLRAVVARLTMLGGGRHDPVVERAQRVILAVMAGHCAPVPTDHQGDGT